MAFRAVYDYEQCSNDEDLRFVIAYINRHKYDLISVTQDASGVYTVFFRRNAFG